VSETLETVKVFVDAGSWLPTTHALMRMERRNILIADVLLGLHTGIIVENYPDDQRGPSVLVLSQDEVGLPIHTLWGIPNNNTNVANLVTAYRPDPIEWLDDWKTRR
jgi:Domain of unknown function (DUF4258)